MSSKTPSAANKPKQKSILDYFNRKSQQIKRSCDHLDTNCDNKCGDHRIEEICLIDEAQITSNEVITIEDNQKPEPIDCDPINEEFIDLSQYLQIDFSIEDKQIDDHFGDNNQNGDENDDSQSDVYYNFRQMIDFVVKDTHSCHLFNDLDLNVIEHFTCLSGSAQMLFIRLFMRKRFWIRRNAIKYPEICPNLGPVLEELIEKKFLLSSNHLSDLSEALDVLDLSEIKRIAKSLKGVNTSSVNTKKNIKNLIIQYLNTSQPVFKTDRSLCDILMNSIKGVLKGKCFRVNEEFCGVFERMFLLYSKPESNEEELNSQISYEFFKILRAKTEREIYPKYTLNKSSVIYETREDLMRYSEAFKLEIEILSAIDEKNLDLILNDLMLRAKQNYFDLTKDNYNHKDIYLPEFLRRFTSAATYMRCLSHCVSILEQKKLHSEAVHVLREILLCQTIYCNDYRGRWFERLALNLDKHLKDPVAALEVIEKGLDDSYVRTGHRLALYNRLKNIKKSFKTKISLIPEFEAIKYNEVTIMAQTLKYTINDRKNIFKTTDSNGDVSIMSVEDIAINHYKNNGFTQGIHTESRIYHTILCLLFWDIIYMSETQEVVDSFRYEYQRVPLDFNSDQFFTRRESQITTLLNTLKSMSIVELLSILENSWEKHFGIVSLINWENCDIKQIKEIVASFGCIAVSYICERLIKDYRHTRSGFPDLIVWNESTEQIKVVEVKGPNDRPSTKQLLWLSFFHSLGLDVEICHVKASKGFALS